MNILIISQRENHYLEVLLENRSNQLGWFSNSGHDLSSPSPIQWGIIAQFYANPSPWRVWKVMVFGEPLFQAFHFRKHFGILGPLLTHVPRSKTSMGTFVFAGIVTTEESIWPISLERKCRGYSPSNI